ncbi:Ras-related protein Rab-7b, partial [Galemys pyrenaicus]
LSREVTASAFPVSHLSLAGFPGGQRRPSQNANNASAAHVSTRKTCKRLWHEGTCCGEDPVPAGRTQPARFTAEGQGPPSLAPRAEQNFLRPRPAHGEDAYNPGPLGICLRLLLTRAPAPAPVVRGVTAAVHEALSIRRDLENLGPNWPDHYKGKTRRREITGPWLSSKVRRSNLELFQVLGETQAGPLWTPGQAGSDQGLVPPGQKSSIWEEREPRLSRHLFLHCPRAWHRVAVSQALTLVALPPGVGGQCCGCLPALGAPQRNWGRGVSGLLAATSIQKEPPVLGSESSEGLWSPFMNPRKKVDLKLIIIGALGQRGLDIRWPPWGLPDSWGTKKGMPPQGGGSEEREAEVGPPDPGGAAVTSPPARPGPRQLHSALSKASGCLWSRFSKSFPSPLLLKVWSSSPDVGNSQSRVEEQALVCAVGKTSLLHQYVHKTFYEDYQTTLGASILSKIIVLDDTTLKLQIWDTGGQERFRSMVSTFYKGSDGCVLAFDVTDSESFEALDTWRGDVLAKAIPMEPSYPMVVLGNKIDLADRQRGAEGGDPGFTDLPRQVSREVAQGWCEEKDIPYFEVSAKNDINVVQAFEMLAGQALSRYRSVLENYLTDSIKLSPEDQPQSRCC